MSNDLLRLKFKNPSLMNPSMIIIRKNDDLEKCLAFMGTRIMVNRKASLHEVTK